MTDAARSPRVALGQVTGVFGVRGWIRLVSYTRPHEGILDYPRWTIAGREWELAEGRHHGDSMVARLEGLDDRDAAMRLRGEAIEVARERLPDPGPGMHYWADLIGFEVVSEGGAVLGTVESVFENGAQDVMVVQGERERLIPFVAGPIVKQVDAQGRRIVVDWEPGY